MEKSTRKLIQDMLKGDKRSLARLMSYVENQHTDVLDVMGEIYARSGRAYRIGVTGPPGAGKSTLVDRLITHYRAQGQRVGVIAIDPSSPFSGGAVLGDRIRMQDHNADEGVFIRSVGSRGAHGGLSRATQDMVLLMDAFGMDVILVETVGVGQTELDIMSVANTTLVILVPESGDTVQTMKAGLLEIADIFIVNKSDREGADRIFHELKSLTEISVTDWVVPVLKTVAVKNEGVAEIGDHITAHQNHLKKNQGHHQTLLENPVEECLGVFSSEMQAIIRRLLVTEPEYKSIHDEIMTGKLNPYTGAQRLISVYKFKQ